MTNSLRAVLLGGAAMLSLAAMASRQAQAQNIYGGGSSLAGPAYGTAAALYEGGTPTFNLFYGTSSSGTGTTAFISNLVCNNYTGSVPCPTTNGSVDVDYAASDAFLSATNLGLLNAALSPAGGSATVVQIPMFATPVAIAYSRNLGSDNVSAGTSTVQLDDNDLCLIFSGNVTTWNSPLLSHPLTVSTPITVIYRSDGSGTSFLMTTHLANVCTSSNSPGVNYNLGGAYPYTNGNGGTNLNAVTSATGGTTFTQIFTKASPVLPVPGNFIGASGSGGVQSAILNTTSYPGAIGYLSPDYTDIAPNNQSATASNPPAATVNGLLPTSGNISSGFSSYTAPTTQAAAINQENYAPIFPVPASTVYPIFGFTYWFLSTCYGSASTTSAITGFLSTYFTNAGYSSAITGSGFAPISSSSKLGKSIAQNLTANANGFNVNIGNETVAGCR